MLRKSCTLLPFYVCGLGRGCVGVRGYVGCSGLCRDKGGFTGVTAVQVFWTGVLRGLAELGVAGRGSICSAEYATQKKEWKPYV